MLAFNRYDNIFLAAAVNLKICAMLQKASYKRGGIKPHVVDILVIRLKNVIPVMLS